MAACSPHTAATLATACESAAVAMAGAARLRALAVQAVPAASSALSGWTSVTIAAARDGRAVRPTERLAAATALRQAHDALHSLADQLLAVALQMDRAAAAHVAAVTAIPTSGRA